MGALDTYETCLASKSAGCSAQTTSALTSTMDSAKAQLTCSSGDNSGNNQADNAANGETSSSVTVACDAKGLQQRLLDATQRVRDVYHFSGALCCEHVIRKLWQFLYRALAGVPILPLLHGTLSCKYLSYYR